MAAGTEADVTLISDANIPSRVWALLLGAFGVAMIWLLVTRSLAAYFALEAPRAALAIRASQPTALVSLADAKLNPPPRENDGGASGITGQVPSDERAPGADRIGGWAEIALKAFTRALPPGKQATAVVIQSNLTQKERDAIRVQAQQALLEDPINARALRILGQLADIDGDKAKAAKLMSAAVDRSAGESMAIYWMLQKSSEENDYANTIRYADLLLRKRPQVAELVVPALAQLAERGDAKAVAALKVVLAANPPWRSAFFYALLGQITDARTPLNLLLSIKDTPNPPTTMDLSAYLNFLIAHKLYELAYYTWLQFLPSDELARVGLLANGGFEAASNGLPFDWSISVGSGATVEISARPDAPGQHALLLELGPGRVEFPGVTQMLLLTPGAYHLKGQLKGQLEGRRGLQWLVVCAAGQPLGESEMFVGEAPDWKDFEFDFTVPDNDCRAQYLRLALAARSASEQLVSGTVWYDSLRLSRLGLSASGN